MEPLKLVALDKDDIAVVSTHLQDAVVRVGDIVWRPAEQRLVLALNRFDWEAAYEKEPQYRRRRTALRFERVRSLKCRHIKPAHADDVLNILAVEFEENDAPSGTVTVFFSGDAALRFEVECLEVELVDLGPAWTTSHCPAHPEAPQTLRG